MNDDLTKRWGGSPMSAEVLEQDAHGETLHLYERLKAAMPAQTVNLVYRRLATIPGALPWAVSLVETLAAESFLPRLAGPLMSTPVPTVSPASRSTWGELGVSPAELESAADILSVYNWANPRNLLVLQFMEKGLAGGGDAASSGRVPDSERSESSAASTPRAGSLEPPLPPEDLAPDVLALAKEICVALAVDPGLLPTLHRHLGGMPQLYRGLVSMTGDLVSGGQVETATLRWDGVAAGLAARENLLLEEPPEESKDGIREVIRQFRLVIPAHCVLGFMWQRCLGAEQTI